MELFLFARFIFSLIEETHAKETTLRMSLRARICPVALLWAWKTLPKDPSPMIFITSYPSTFGYISPTCGSTSRTYAQNVFYVKPAGLSNSSGPERNNSTSRAVEIPILAFFLFSLCKGHPYTLK